jgi:hypothetical protein
VRVRRRFYYPRRILVAAEAAQSAPWWGVPTIAGGFLIIGGAISFISTYVSDKRRAKQELENTTRAENAQRRKELQAATASFLVETRSVYDAYQSNFVADRSGRVERIDGGDKVSLREADRAYWTLVFLASDQVEAAARELINATKKFSRYGRDSRQLTAFPGAGWVSTRNRFFNARQALVLAVKDTPGEVGPEE